MAEQQFIVAVGASAGGLEALTSFFDHTPLDSVSYVVIPHLSPDFKSRMVEILSQYTNLEVLEAAEGMEVQQNKVYLIPNTKFMGIKNGRLFMLEKFRSSKPHMTVDAFFSSLADERGDKAIAVVLSGVGTDGSHGAPAIEKAGGMVMVQEPLDAKFDGMPKAAIAASKGCKILPAAAMPAAIQQYVDERDSDATVEHPFSGNFLNDIINLIKAQQPLDFTDYKIPTLVRRINRRMIHNNIKEENSFLAFLKENPAEVELLISDFLIGVTSFFRDPEAFKVLEQEVIPQITKLRAGSDFLKVWVASCATGQEAYSLAILIDEHLENIKSNIEVKIFATDINRTALSHAAAGVFSAASVKGVSAERLENYFDKHEESYKIKPKIRKMLIFARHDLTKNPPYCDVDLISCRNMLIYVKPEIQKQILEKLGFGLKKDGYLFLGSSENLSIVKEDFREINARWKIYQNIKTKRRINLDTSISTSLSDFPIQQLVKLPAMKVPTPLSPLEMPMNEVILTESGFCGVSIDMEGKVLQAFGNLSPFLKSERFNFNLKELLPESLMIAFSAAFLKVAKNNKRVRINEIAFTEPETSKKSRADLIISPFKDSKSNTQGMMVLFKATDPAPGDNQGPSYGENFELDTHTRQHIKQLEEEVFGLRQDLLFSQELLESSKDAMQAYNEELLSANEEMQSANEELQSINEELETVNAEHKYTIADLSNLNDDLNNYFKSNINGQLFVDRDILLKKFSPGAIKHINIQDGDIGRPLSNITTNIKFETLIEDIKSVIDHGEIIMKEIESTDGRIYQVMTSPYLRKIDDQIHGAIITFYDISELKKIQNELDGINKMLTLATESAEIGTWSIEVESHELICSARLKNIFGFRVEDEVNFENLLNRISGEHRYELVKAFNASIHNGEKFEIECPINVPPDAQTRWIRVIGSLTDDKDGKAGFLTGIIQDITDHKLDDIRKNDFIAIVSHELKTPLTSITGFIQALIPRAQKADDTLAIHFLTKANNQVRRMTALITGFLNVSRLEGGKIHLDKQVFEIDELIEEIVEEMSTISGNNIIILQKCSVPVNADREKIGQVISNILSNAIKYAPKLENIEVTCMKLDDTVQVSFRDQGPGINQADQGRLFDRYFRIEREDKKMIPGFGIGLYLSSEIIQRHDGKIWVESKIGAGSTFYFSLPLD